MRRRNGGEGRGRAVCTEPSPGPVHEDTKEGEQTADCSRGGSKGAAGAVALSPCGSYFGHSLQLVGD